MPTDTGPFYSVVAFMPYFCARTATRGLHRFYVAASLTQDEALEKAAEYRRLYVYPPNGGLHSVGIEQEAD